MATFITQNKRFQEMKTIDNQLLISYNKTAKKSDEIYFVIKTTIFLGKRAARVNSFILKIKLPANSDNREKR